MSSTAPSGTTAPTRAGRFRTPPNAGLVTDHPYSNLVVASPLVPEEAFGAFIGENPNGTWTITISDDLAGDGGALNSWSLDFKTFQAVPINDFDGDGKSDILWRDAG